MSNFKRALNAVLRHEGGFWHDEKTGEIVNRGVTLKTYKQTHPEATEETIRNLTPEETEAFYQNWWDQHRFDSIAAPILAAKVFDISINVGMKTGIRLLQSACNIILDSKIKVDGRIGKQTTQAFSLCDPLALRLTFLSVAKQHYQTIVRNHPEKTRFLSGWLTRLYDSV